MPRTSRTDRKIKKFLVVLGNTANVCAACREAGIPRQNVYEWRKQDPNFANMMDAAVELGTFALEDEAVRRGMQGWEEPVYYKGEEVGSVRRYSDTLLITLLKARKPEKYREGIEDAAGRAAIVNINVVTVGADKAPLTGLVEVSALGESSQQDRAGLPEATAVP